MWNKLNDMLLNGTDTILDNCMKWNIIILLKKVNQILKVFELH